ncbi:unnamed protein product [Hymenolepis diminuta]|uniref:Uncharacterized protein n=1 Tax=Hymenolepis diminuta TaxID=6216 RepID=A0A564ZAH4_HYMDI|nr:unnamed protein product [Hymenolepis diminuta]
MMQLFLLTMTFLFLTNGRPTMLFKRYRKSTSEEDMTSIDPELVNWLKSQDPASLPNSPLKDNDNVDNGNPNTWKDIFKFMAQLNDYYVLFGRARFG